MNTRDTFGQAIKATYSEVNGSPVEIYKTPKTDSGMKNSAKGLIAVFKKTNGDFYMIEQVTMEEVKNCEYIKIFENGKMYNEASLQEIRERLNNGRLL